MQVGNLLHKWNVENDQACNKLPTSFQLVRLVGCGLIVGHCSTGLHWFQVQSLAALNWFLSIETPEYDIVVVVSVIRQLTGNLRMSLVYPAKLNYMSA